MTALGYAIITFVCTVVCAVLGTTIRTWLPEPHLNKESQDVIRLGMGLVATMTALLLGLVTATAKGSFDIIFWLSMTFASFGLTAPRNATVVTVLVISALSVAAAVFLILELDGPFEGLIRISGEPLRFALANLGR